MSGRGRGPGLGAALTQCQGAAAQRGGPGFGRRARGPAPPPPGCSPALLTLPRAGAPPSPPRARVSEAAGAEGAPASPRPSPPRPLTSPPSRQNGGGGRVPAGRGSGAARRSARRGRPEPVLTPAAAGVRSPAASGVAPAAQRPGRGCGGGVPAAANKDAIIGLARRSRGSELPGWEAVGEGEREGEAGGVGGAGGGGRGQEEGGGGAQAAAGRLRALARAACAAGRVSGPSPVGPLPAGRTPLEGGPPRPERPLAGPGRGGRLLPVPSLSLSSAILLRSRRPGDAWRHPRSRRPCPLQPPRESTLGHRRLRSLRAGDPRAGAGGGSERAPLPPRAPTSPPPSFPRRERGLLRPRGPRE